MQIRAVRFIKISAAVLISSCLVIFEPALVQAEGAGAIEEVVVTARKREEALQNVALAVSAMSQREVELNFATDTRELVYISPNTVLDDTHQGPGGVAAAYIRGIGVSEVEKNFDPAVGVVVDQLFLGTMSGGITRSIDIERFEVLRGPQGTLYGRNTIGGVINVSRSQPTMEFGGKMRIGYGDYDTTVADGVLNFGDGESIGVKLTGSFRDQGDGFFKNLVTGNDDGRNEYTSGGINVLWIPREDLELEATYIAERTDQDNPPLLNAGQPGQLFCTLWNWCSPSTDTPVSGDRYKVLSAYGEDVVNPFPGVAFGPPGYFEPHGFDDSTFDADTYQFELRWDLNENYRVDYIVGRWETEETAVNDWDAVPEILFHTDRPAEYEQTSHELRLTYDAGGKLTYTVGAYHWDSDYEIRLRSYIGFVIPGLVLDLPQTTNQTNESTAVFFEGDYRISDRWTVTVGGRWTKDEKTTDQVGVNNGAAKEDWDEFTPKVALKLELDEAMIYGLFSRGYRAGGFNGRVDSFETATTPYDPETVDNLEIGYRSEHFDRRLIFNATAFYMDYEDKQEEIQQPSTTSGTGQVTRVVNAADATVKGAELELMWMVTENLNLRANLGILDASYDDFTVNLGTLENPVLTDFSDLDIRRAPDVTFSIGGDYQRDFGPGSLVVRANARYLDEHEVDFANKPELHNDSQILVDASINYYLNDWNISLYGHNLADEDGYQIGFDVAGLWSYAAPRRPRTWGLEVGYTW